MVSDDLRAVESFTTLVQAFESSRGDEALNFDTVSVAVVR